MVTKKITSQPGTLNSKNMKTCAFFHIYISQELTTQKKNQMLSKTF